MVGMQYRFVKSSYGILRLLYTQSTMKLQYGLVAGAMLAGPVAAAPKPIHSRSKSFIFMLFGFYSVTRAVSLQGVANTLFR